MILQTVLHVENLLKQNEKFVDKDGNVFIQNILEAIERIDRDLVKLLISDKKTREQFFIKIDDVFVLEQNKLIEFFTMNEYFNNSFTAYTNKIGLIKKDSFIKKFDDVVLAWPHKDCVLEGGQSKDDEKNNEVFYNEILSRDEIDRLFEPKALTNIKRYTKNGVEENPQISEDDNLIIKGNNLIALHSLKRKYAGKVKLIYIDPPYNTGNDSFKYNDRFNHSTWLTFMKNRLEVAREFLSEDGAIFVQCDDNEQAYLKVLMDEIFGNENTDYIVWNKEAEEKSGTLKQVKRFRTIHEIINIAYKNKKNTLFNKISEPLIGKEKELHTANLAVNEGKEKDGHPNWMEIMAPNGTKWNKHWKFDNQTIKKYLKEDLIYYGKNGTNQPRLILPMDHRRKVYLSSILNKGSTTMGRSELEDMFKKDIFSYPKPEILIKIIIDISTNENDLVMDFHLGSGTTCAVAHKMGRRYIGIEQMDYIEDIAVERMKKVLDGEQGGISKAVKWSGGGSFIYAELKQIENFKDAEIGKLNANMQYLPVSEMQDADYDMSDEEIEINKAFYGLENE